MKFQLIREVDYIGIVKVSGNIVPENSRCVSYCLWHKHTLKKIRGDYSWGSNLRSSKHNFKWYEWRLKWEKFLLQRWHPVSSKTAHLSQVELAVWWVWIQQEIPKKSKPFKQIKHWSFSMEYQAIFQLKFTELEEKLTASSQMSSSIALIVLADNFLPAFCPSCLPTEPLSLSSSPSYVTSSATYVIIKLIFTFK